MISQRIIADVGTNKSDSIHFVQGEQGRVINVHFINSLIDENVFLDLSGYDVTIHILKPDGNFTIDNMSTNGYTASYSLNDQDCIAGGSGIYDISLSKNNELIYTAHGDYIGDMRAIPDSAVNSVSTAYGVTFPEGFQEKLTAGEGITIAGNVISARGKEYTGGVGIDIEGETISLSNEAQSVLDSVAYKQDELTAGTGIDITNDVIRATSVYNRDILFNGSVNMLTSPTIDLTGNIFDYDDLIFVYTTMSGVSIPFTFDIHIMPELFNEGQVLLCGLYYPNGAGLAGHGHVTNDQLIVDSFVNAWFTNCVLKKIYGITY